MLAIERADIYKVGINDAVMMVAIHKRLDLVMEYSALKIGGADLFLLGVIWFSGLSAFSVSTGLGFLLGRSLGRGLLVLLPPELALHGLEALFL